MSTSTTLNTPADFQAAREALAAVLGWDDPASPFIIDQVQAIADQGTALAPLADQWRQHAAAKRAQAQQDTATHNLAGAAGFYGTPAQFRFIGTLLAERELTLQMQNWWHAVTIGEARCDKRGASRFIDALQQQPRKPTEGEPLAEGYYADGDTVYVLVTSKAGNLYAKQWTVAEGHTKASWVYAPGAAKALAAKGARPMTLDEAKAWGHQHGRCIRCGRVLSDPASVEAGIGPVCAGYWL